MSLQRAAARAGQAMRLATDARLILERPAGEASRASVADGPRLPDDGPAAGAVEGAAAVGRVTEVQVRVTPAVHGCPWFPTRA